MRYFKIIIVTLIFGFFFYQCRKDKKDEITMQNLNGMVFNNCTDSGFAGVKVYFQTIKDNSVISSRETISELGGNFSFSNAEIHSNEEYRYAMYIQSKSGIGATSPEYSLFNGTTMYFKKDQTSTFFKPRVTPGFFKLRVAYQGTCNLTDTVNPTFTQNTFHKNDPSIPYEFTLGTNGSAPNTIVSNDNYPMGKYSIKIVKFKNNAYTTTYDSIYLGAADTKTYTINW